MKQIYLTVLVGFFFLPTLLISQNFSVSGIITLHNGEDPLPDIEVPCFNTVITDADGFYQISDIPLNTTCELLPVGTYDKFEDITILDGLLLRQHILGLDVLNEFQLIAGDVNNSNGVSTFDIVKIVRLATKEDDGNDPNWQFFNSNDPFTSLFGITVTNNLENINFTAVKKGDVAISSDHIPAPPIAPTPIFAITQNEFEAGDLVKIEVNVDNLENIQGVQSTFSWDPSLLEFESISGQQHLQIISNLDFISQGQLPALTINNLDFIQGETLFTLEFIALADSPNLDNHVKMTDEIIPRQAVWENPATNELFIVDGEYIENEVQPVSVNSIPSELVKFNIYPNPVDKYLNVNVLLKEITEFEISIVNVLGQLVFLNKFKTDELSDEVDLSNLRGGIYFLNLRTERGVVTEMFIKK